MMPLLNGYLDQIATSSRAIGDLEFPPSKVFTNAILGQHEITTLLRDTEPHEKSLFTLDPNAYPTAPYSSSNGTFTAATEGMNRRKTISQMQQRQGSVVGRVLGNDMLRKIQQSSRGHGRSRGVDVEVLLQGAEKLCAVYPKVGANERITKLRARHNQFAQSISFYEGLVTQQQAKLNRLNTHQNYPIASDNEENETEANESESMHVDIDLDAEIREIKELEDKKKTLEARVADMEKDLGGLLR